MPTATPCNSLADGCSVVESKRDAVLLKDDTEVEYFKTVGIKEEVDSKAVGVRFRMHFTPQAFADEIANIHGKEPLPFMAEVVEMNWLGPLRVPLGLILFVVTFGFIIAETIHRVYVTLVGGLLGIFLVTLINEQLHLHEVTAMIDFGTLMLLLSMMANVNFLVRSLREPFDKITWSSFYTRMHSSARSSIF